MVDSDSTSDACDFTRGRDSTALHSDPQDVDYITRRWVRLGLHATGVVRLFDGPSKAPSLDEVSSGVVAREPLAQQVAFRLRMLGAVALQLLTVTSVVAVFRVYAPLVRLTVAVFSDPLVAWAIAVAAFVAAVALLVTLYSHRAQSRLRWLLPLLLLFTCVQCLCLVGVSFALDTHAVGANCAFTSVCVLVMLLLSPLRRRATVDEPHELLLTTFAAGAIAFVAVALVSYVLFLASLAFDCGVISSRGLGASLACQLVLVLWLAFDASCVYRVASPSEHALGVVYLYADTLQLVVSVLAVVGACACRCGYDEACVYGLWTDAGMAGNDGGRRHRCCYCCWSSQTDAGTSRQHQLAISTTIMSRV